MLSQLWTMTASDLRQRVRDRSVIIFGLVVPIALMYVFNLVFGDTQDLELQPTTVVVSVPDGDDLAAPVLTVLQEADFGDFDVTVAEAPADEVRSRVEDGDAHLGLLVPSGFGEALRSGEVTEVEAVQGDGREVEAQIVLSVTNGVLEQLASASQAAAAAARAGVPPDELATVAEEAVSRAPEGVLVEGEASEEQLDSAGALVAGQAGLFLLFTVGFGVLGLVWERESGTLARLRSMPMRTGLIVAAKALVSFILGTVATAILLTAGGLLFDVSFGSLPAVALLVVCVVTATTSLTFVIVRLARTSEQAQIAQNIVAITLGIAGGAFFPVSAPPPVDRLLDANPVAAFTRGLGITSNGGGVADIVVPVTTMLVFGAVMVLVSRVVPDRGMAS